MTVVVLLSSGYSFAPGLASRLAAGCRPSALDCSIGPTVGDVRVDVDLVRRMEHSAARHGALLVEAMAATVADDVPVHQPLDGGELLAMGAGRYVNRAVGVGLGDVAPHDLLDELEDFYRSRGLLPQLEVSPWVGAEHRHVLRDRTYVLDWFRNVFARALDDLPPRPTGVVFADVDDALVPGWSAVLGGETAPGSPQRAVNDEFCAAAHRVPGTLDLVTLDDGRPVACGSLVVIDGVAWLGAAATLTSARGRGLQTALLAERLHRAADAGAELAGVTALPDGTSARNLTATGFRTLYTQAVMSRPV